MPKAKSKSKAVTNIGLNKAVRDIMTTKAKTKAAVITAKAKKIAVRKGNSIARGVGGALSDVVTSAAVPIATARVAEAQALSNAGGEFNKWVGNITGKTSNPNVAPKDNEDNDNNDKAGNSYFGG